MLRLSPVVADVNTDMLQSTVSKTWLCNMSSGVFPEAFLGAHSTFHDMKTDLTLYFQFIEGGEVYQEISKVPIIHDVTIQEIIIGELSDF